MARNRSPDGTTPPVRPYRLFGLIVLVVAALVVAGFVVYLLISPPR